MKKIAFIIALGLIAPFAVSAAVNPVIPVMNNIDQIVYAKVINDTGSEFQYKVGTTEYLIEIGESEPMAFEENSQLLKKDSNGNWVNWFVFGATHSGQSINLSTLLN